MATPLITSYFKTPTTGQTVYGKAETGQVVGFQTPEQLAQAQGVSAPNFNIVQNRDDVDTSKSVLYTDFLGSNQTQVDLSKTQPTKGLDIATASVAGASAATKSIEQYIKELTPPATPEKQSYQNILNEISALTGKQEQKGEDTLKAQEAAGIKQKQQELMNFSNEMNMKVAEYDQLKQSYDQLITENRARPVTLGTIQGENANIQFAQQQALNSKAAEIGIVQAKVSAAQGNLGLAQQQVTDAINLKYETINAQLNTKLAQLDAIAPILNEQERVFAAALEAKYRDEQVVLEREQKLEERAFNLALEYGVTAPMFEVGGIIYDSRTGQAEYENVGGEIRRLSDGFAFSTPDEFFLDSGLTNWNQIQSVEQLRQARETQVLGQEGVANLMAQYPDAGILPSDDIATAQSKLGGSAIYREQTRPPQYAGGGGGDPIPGEDPGLYEGLDSKTATAVRSVVSGWKSEPVVQNFAVIQEGKDFATSIADDTKNPADDQALIYALAKALDPGSVVREGEYATAQKYSQSWISAYGKGIEQALLGTGFLSQEARANIKKTIVQKYGASKKSYDNLYNQYAGNINNLTGRSDGDRFLRDYRIESSPSENELSDEEAYNLYLDQTSAPPMSVYQPVTKPLNSSPAYSSSIPMSFLPR